MPFLTTAAWWIQFLLNASLSWQKLLGSFLLRQQETNDRLLLYDTSVYQMNSLCLFFLLRTTVPVHHSARPPSWAMYFAPPSTWCWASSCIPTHDAFTADQKRPPKQSVLPASQFLSSLQKTVMHLRAVMLPLHFCFSLRTTTVYLFFFSPDILQPLHIFLDLETRNWIQALSHAFLLFISFPSRQILGHRMILLFISWHLKHGSLALGTYTLTDIHVNVNV